MERPRSLQYGPSCSSLKKPTPACEPPAGAAARFLRDVRINCRSAAKNALDLPEDQRNCRLGLLCYVVMGGPGSEPTMSSPSS